VLWEVVGDLVTLAGDPTRCAGYHSPGAGVTIITRRGDEGGASFEDVETQLLGCQQPREGPRVFTRSSCWTGITVAAVSDTAWGEATITYNNRPAPGATIGASGSISTNTWFSVDVASQVQGTER
jgi:hypothetical protein